MWRPLAPNQWKSLQSVITRHNSPKAGGSNRFVRDRPPSTTKMVCGAEQVGGNSKGRCCGAIDTGNINESTSIYSKLCGGALIQTHKPCAGAETVEHPFATLKARMGATHLLTKTLGDSPRFTRASGSSGFWRCR